MAESECHSVVSDSLWHPWTSPLNSPGQNTGVGSLSLLLGVFPTQGRSNPGLSHCRWILYQLSHKGSPRTLEWVVYPFSSGSSQARNRTQVSCTAGGFFTNWALREVLLDASSLLPTCLDLNFCHHASLTRHLAACRAIHVTCTTDAQALGLPRSPVTLVPLHCLRIPDLLVLSPPINP